MRSRKLLSPNRLEPQIGDDTSQHVRTTVWEALEELDDSTDFDDTPTIKIPRLD